MKKSILIIVGTLFFVACRKQEVKSPNFDAVLVEKTTYKVGEEVIFNFSGEADQISFYSGEKLHDYEYSKESRTSLTQSVKVSFQTNVTNFTAVTGQNNQLSVFVSSNYNGGGTYADIVAAEWKGKDDLDPFFTIAPDTNPWGAGNNFPSGVIELINAFEADKPLYIGFKYKNTPPGNVSGNYPRAWYIYNMDGKVSTLLGTNTIFSTVGVYSLIYSNHFDTEDKKNSDITTNIKLQLPTSLRLAPAEVWAISPPIYLEEIDHGPDRPKAIKGYRNPMPLEYKHIYTNPGTYTATFVGYNSNANEQKEIIKKIEIKITE